MRRPRTGSDLTSRTVFIRLNAEAFVKFLAFPMRRLLLIFASICGISSRATFNPSKYGMCKQGSIQIPVPDRENAPEK